MENHKNDQKRNYDASSNKLEEALWHKYLWFWLQVIENSTKETQIVRKIISFNEKFRDRVVPELFNLVA